MTVIKVTKFWPSHRSGAVAALHQRHEPLDGLDAFGSEAPFEPEIELSAEPPVTTPVAEQSVGRGRRRKAFIVLTWMLALGLSAGVAGASVWQYQLRVSSNAAGALTIHTSPAGAEVFIAGKTAGLTPLTTNLAPGLYDVQIASHGQKRDLKVALAAGASVFHQLEFAAVPAAASPVGSLRVQTEFRDAVVSIDGIERGVSPLTVENLDPGDHQVVVRGDRGTFRRTVQIKANETLSLVISPTEPAAIVPGWLTVSSPIPMQLREGGRIIGTTESDRLMLTSGEHEIEISNEELGYRSSRKVAIAAGKTATVAVELPTGLLNVNALPWAEVWVDGERVGETPIANLSRRIGTHQVQFRHPHLGERSETVVVTLRQPARLGVDMRRQ